MNQFTVIVEADTNDGDIITEVTHCSEEDKDRFVSLIGRVKSFKEYTASNGECERTHRHNFSTGELLRLDLGEKSPAELYGYNDMDEEFVNGFLPYGEYGIHTIESVKYHKFVESTFVI